MSWIYGLVGDFPTSLAEKNKSLPKSPRFLYKSDKIFIAADGIKETLTITQNDDNSGFIVLGIGINTFEQNLGFINSEQWQRIIDNYEHDRYDLNGHFTVIKYDETSIKIFNDPLGVRDLFFLQTKSFIAFSSRIDWLTKLQENTQINLDTFGSAWLTANQIMHESLISGLERLGPGGNAVISRSLPSLKINNTIWEPDWGKTYSGNEMIECLESFLIFPQKENKTISLGLSGGLDSRTLLAIYLNKIPGYFFTHVFGNEAENSDASTAKRITDDLNLHLEIIKDKTTDQEEILKTIYKLIPFTWFGTPVNELFVIPYHQKLYEQNKFIIDGAYGEILRREFLSRVLFLGRDSVTKKKAEKFFNFIRKDRGSFFSPDINSILYKSALEKINVSFEEMPDCRKIGLENWLDYFSIIYKLPNLGALGQICLDQFSAALMPFIQPDLLKISFGVPPADKKNGKVYRKIIKNYNSKLENYPLIKNLISYPYNSKTLKARIITTAKKKMMPQHAMLEYNVIDHLYEFIYDKINSREVKDCDMYDHIKIRHITDSYFNGERGYKKELESWLTFEIWREIIMRKN